jgi:hypothetical protein
MENVMTVSGHIRFQDIMVRSKLGRKYTINIIKNGNSNLFSSTIMIEDEISTPKIFCEQHIKPEMVSNEDAFESSIY